MIDLCCLENVLTSLGKLPCIKRIICLRTRKTKKIISLDLLKNAVKTTAHILPRQAATVTNNSVKQNAVILVCGT